MTCFNKMVTHGADADVISITMAYSQRGSCLVKPLCHDDRLIPDLYDLLRGGMNVDCHLHTMDLSNDPEVLKRQMMEEYHNKDKLLKAFYENGSFPPAHPSISPAPEGWSPK